MGRGGRKPGEWERGREEGKRKRNKGEGRKIIEEMGRKQKEAQQRVLGRGR